LVLASDWPKEKWGLAHPFIIGEISVWSSNNRVWAN